MTKIYFCTSKCKCICDVLTYLIGLCLLLGSTQIDYFIINNKIIQTKNTKAHLYLSHLFVTALVLVPITFVWYIDKI